MIKPIKELTDEEIKTMLSIISYEYIEEWSDEEYSQGFAEWWEWDNDDHPDYDAVEIVDEGNSRGLDHMKIKQDTYTL